MRELNLQALAGRNPSLAARIASAGPDPLITFSHSRDGQPVPCISTAGRQVAMHSLVDPRREGERLAATAQHAGFVVALGLGAGWHLRPLLARADLAGLLVIERDPGAVAALLAGADLRDILSDPRVVVTAGEPPSRIRGLVLGAYTPVLCGALRALPLRPWCDAAREWADGASQAVREAAADARADFATQARFGRRWFAKILGNLPLVEDAEGLEDAEGVEDAEGAAARLSTSGKALVAAAGPSLEDQLPEIACGRTDALLLSVDTALPALEAAGIRPDLVVSIDCQHHGLYHFYGGQARQEHLVLDLASPPCLARAVSRRSYAAGAHPLCALLARRWRPFPGMDVTGGNVTHAAVSLAARLGAKDITVFGADFSYPDGKPYARGTYLYDFFGCRAARLLPAETSFFAFLHRAEMTERESVAGGVRYTSALLRAYRDGLQRLAGRLAARVKAPAGRGLPLDFTPEPGQERDGLDGDGTAPRPPAGPSPGWRGFLRWYADCLDRAPAARAPVAAWFAGLDPTARETWQTLLPGAAFELRESLARGGAADPRPSVAALEKARAWALGRVSRALSEDDPGVADE